MVSVPIVNRHARLVEVEANSRGLGFPLLHFLSRADHNVVYRRPGERLQRKTSLESKVTSASHHVREVVHPMSWLAVTFTTQEINS